MRRSGMNTGMILMIVLLFLNRMRMAASNPSAFFYNILIMLPGIIIGISIHEFGHAFAADKLGDPTPRSQGRVTLNPLAHIDPFGFIALIFGGFGWGKPVMIDPRYYKHPRRDRMFVAFAGVINNAIVVLIAAFITRIFYRNAQTGGANNVILDILVEVISINICLMIFNLLPVPPLDGFNIITEIFDLRTKSWYRQLYEAGGAILLALVLFGITGRILTPAINGIFNLVVDHIILA